MMLTHGFIDVALYYRTLCIGCPKLADYFGPVQVDVHSVDNS